MWGSAGKCSHLQSYPTPQPAPCWMACGLTSAPLLPAKPQQPVPSPNAEEGCASSRPALVAPHLNCTLLYPHSHAASKRGLNKIILMPHLQISFGGCLKRHQYGRPVTAAFGIRSSRADCCCEHCFRVLAESCGGTIPACAPERVQYINGINNPEQCLSSQTPALQNDMSEPRNFVILSVTILS